MAESLVQEWNVWETQTIVLLSFMLQLFLLATGSLRRHNISGLLRALIWLCYVGADPVAVYALGLFSQYEDKYKLGRESFGDTLPFLWVPFLLVHLGGQDSITAFSLEDNNLWLRHLLNLGTQGVIALYVLWRSFDRINVNILVPAMLVFVSGIIKYGERVWALKSASRNGFVKSSSNPISQVKYLTGNQLFVGSKESYALQTVLLARGLFVGRNVFQLGNEAATILVFGFNKKYQGREEKLKMVVMELGMMFDLFYTKANVLQRRTCVLFRCASQALMVVALVLFMIRREEGAHNKVNVAITYTLFSGAIFIEICYFVAVMASPWTRAHLKESSCLGGLSDLATSFFEAVHQCNKRHRMTLSSTATMAQFNLMDYCISIKSKPRVFSKALSAIGLDKQWYVHHIDDAGGRGSYRCTINHVLEYLATLDDDFTLTIPTQHLAGFEQLSLPFEHVLYRLHMYTDLYLCRHFNNCSTGVIPPPPPEIMRLKEECETLSNYMMYLMVVHPSMLPVNTVVAGDLEHALIDWVTNNHGDGGATTKLAILECYARSELEIVLVPGSGSPLDLEQNGSFHLQQSLTQIKEMWVRLLMYAAGKCGGEMHARQLGEGGELITFVWLLMLHHGLGDVARELKLLRPNHPNIAERRGASFVSSAQSNQEPLYAFNLPAFRVEEKMFEDNPVPMDMDDFGFGEDDANPTNNSARDNQKGGAAHNANGSASNNEGVAKNNDVNAKKVGLLGGQETEVLMDSELEGSELGTVLVPGSPNMSFDYGAEDREVSGPLTPEGLALAACPEAVVGSSVKKRSKRRAASSAGDSIVRASKLKAARNLDMAFSEGSLQGDTLV